MVHKKGVLVKAYVAPRRRCPQRAMPSAFANRSSSERRLPEPVFNSSSSNAVTREASSDRIMVLTGPIEAGAMEIERKPMPISVIASSGLPAISPQDRKSGGGGKR